VTNYDAGGVLPPGPENFAVRAHGRCPLDGYHLIETEPVTVMVDGEPVETEPVWEHVIPPGDLARLGEALARIAEAHGFEASAAAEQITRGIS
jgi:hypothetical protein